jgi:hypothetical protein
MYLIEAEAAADKGDYTVALAALNALRTARGLGAYAGTGADLITEIQQERRRELFAEGHRLFDLKRRGLPLTRTGVERGAWNGAFVDLPIASDRFEYPIPQEELDANKALTAADQNPAYR